MTHATVARGRTARRLLIGAAASVLMAAGILAAGATAAFAEADDYAVAGSPPAGMSCLSVPTGTGCFKAYGDQWWSYSVGNNSARIIWTNELWDGTRWFTYRTGRCLNLQAKDQWAVCNKDYYEHQTIRLPDKVSGSRLIFTLCVDTCSASRTVYNDQ